MSASTTSTSPAAGLATDSLAPQALDTQRLAARIADSLGLSQTAIKSVLDLFATGATVPFIARYRKEKTGGLDEVALRNIEEAQTNLLELDKRKQSILKAIEAQGKLTDALAKAIAACEHKVALEDLYLPYKSKRRTKATIAKESGLEPLAQRILAQPQDADPDKEAAGYIREASEGLPDTAVPTAQDALEGARAIIIETFVQDPKLRQDLRTLYHEKGAIATERGPKAPEDDSSKFKDYFDYQEAAARIPSHRYLAIRRGEQLGEIRAHLRVDSSPLVNQAKSSVNPKSPYAPHLSKAIEHAVARRLGVSVETDLRLELKKKADLAAVGVFAENLESLLLSAPLGTKSVLGIDPGIRTGCKCAMLTATGDLVEHFTIYPLRGKGDVAPAEQALMAMVKKHQPEAIAIGNGTGGRETEKLVRGWIQDLRPKPLVVSVSESGASIYSASEIAREEFPDLDLTVRGAISIARRLQDPLAELVKVDPKSIGVGQYQHDVQQSLLQKKLGEVVESCVNRVGVEVNTASAPLLGYVAGIGPSLAKKIVLHREQHGMFGSRQAIKEVSGFGDKAFEQAGGFLRVAQSPHPLDASAVHPERYELVEKMAKDLGLATKELIGNASHIDRIDPSRYTDEQVGQATLVDILTELQKPGRDPRKAFEAVDFRDDVSDISHLEPGMHLSGIVTNVTAFGAFVDIGVHQDGLVHISQLADRFVKDPNQIVRVGDKLKVWVLSIDLPRKRIALSAKAAYQPEDPKPSGPRVSRPPSKNPRHPKFSNNPFAALAKNGPKDRS